MQTRRAGTKVSGERGCIGSHKRGSCQGAPRGEKENVRITGPSGQDDAGAGEKRKEPYG